MKAANFSDPLLLKRALQETPVLPKLILLRCRDPILTEEIHQCLLAELQKRQPSFTVEDIRLNGLDCKLQALHGEIATIPMFSELRCIFLRHADGILRELDRLAKNEEGKKILTSFEKKICHLPETTWLIIQIEEKKIPSSLAFLEKTDWIFEERELREKDLPTFLLTRAKTMGYEISAATAEQLAAKSAYNARAALHALDQLFTYKLHDKKITTEDVHTLVSDIEGELHFQVVEEIARRNIPAALQKFTQTRLEEGGITLGLWNKLFSDYVRYHGYIAAGVSSQEALAILGVPPFRMAQVEDKFRKMAQLYSSTELVAILERFIEYDRRLKENTTLSAARDLLVSFLVSLAT